MRRVILETMPLGDDELNEIEEETREQGNDMTGRWLTHRLSRLTSSNFGVVCKRRHTTPVANLVKNLLYCRPSNKAASICWGRENEDNARKAYAEEISKRGTSVAITKSGLIISSSRQYLACSPDDLVKDESSDNMLGTAEYKCPYTQLVK